MKTPAETLAALQAAHTRVAAVELAYNVAQKAAQRMLADALAARGQAASAYSDAFSAAVAHLVKPGDTIRVTRQRENGPAVGTPLVVEEVMTGMLDDVDTPHVYARPRWQDTVRGTSTVKARHTVWHGDYEVVERAVHEPAPDTTTPTTPTAEVPQ